MKSQSTPIWRTLLEDVTQPRSRVSQNGTGSRVHRIPITEATYSTTERQGPGRAYWFETADDARAFAVEKAKLGHKVIYDSYSPDYVWVSYSKKYTSEKVKQVLAGIDPVAVAEVGENALRETPGTYVGSGQKPEYKPGPVKLSALIKYYAKSWGGAQHLYHNVIPNLKRQGRLVKDVPDYPAPTMREAAVSPETVRNQAKVVNTLQSRITNNPGEVAGNVQTAKTMSPAQAKAALSIANTPTQTPGSQGVRSIPMMQSLDLLQSLKLRMVEATRAELAPQSAKGKAPIGKTDPLVSKGSGKKEPAPVTAAVTPLRYQAATVIAKTLGGARISGPMTDFKLAGGTPEQLINIALRAYLRVAHTVESWHTTGRMLELARSMNIKWDPTILSPSHRKIMDLA